MNQSVLISSAGRRNQLIDCFRQDARALCLDIRLLAADLRPALSPACQQADASFAVPLCTAPDFIPALLELCRRESVGLLVPTIDTELAVLSQHAAQFTAAGTRVLVSSPEVVALAGNKLLTAERLAAVGVPTPRTLSLADYLRDPARLRAPVIAKPLGGSASIGIVRPRHLQELVGLDPERYLVQELWKGREFTVNVFFDRSGRLCCAVPNQGFGTNKGWNP